MTKENQKKLYEHFKKLIDNPRYSMDTNLKHPDDNFIIKQAKEQTVAILKVYPEFGEKEEPKEEPKPKTNSKKKVK